MNKKQVEFTKQDVATHLMYQGCIDGGHHKQAVIDKAIQMLVGEEEYEKMVIEFNGPEDEYGETEYVWDVGIPG